MTSIDTERISGWLNLDDYFKRQLGRDFQGKEDLSLNRLIEAESEGTSNKFWIIDKKTSLKIALFKEINFYRDEAYAELISEEVAKLLGMKAAHYDLAIFNNKYGVISYNFLKGDEYLIYGGDILVDFYERKLENDEELCELYGIDYNNDDLVIVTSKLNNLEDIWSVIEDRFKDEPNKRMIVKSFMEGLVNKLIFDILMVNHDDHSENWAELNKEMPPHFDGARSLNLHMDVSKISNQDIDKMEHRALSLTVSNSEEKRPLYVLEEFLKKSSSEYRDLLMEKVSFLREKMIIIPSIVESRTGAPIPYYLKTYFVNALNYHLDEVDKVICGNNNRKILVKETSGLHS